MIHRDRTGSIHSWPFHRCSINEASTQSSAQGNFLGQRVVESSLSPPLPSLSVTESITKFCWLQFPTSLKPVYFSHLNCNHPSPSHCDFFPVPRKQPPHCSLCFILSPSNSLFTWEAGCSFRNAKSDHMLLLLCLKILQRLPMALKIKSNSSPLSSGWGTPAEGGGRVNTGYCKASVG